jgi:hypothetical protein
LTGLTKALYCLSPQNMRRGNIHEGISPLPYSITSDVSKHRACGATRTGKPDGTGESAYAACEFEKS